MSTTIKCKECKEEFTISDGEKSFYENRKLSLPKRCKKCRSIKRQEEGLKLKDCIGKWVIRTRPCYNGDKSWMENHSIFILDVNEKENNFDIYDNYLFGKVSRYELDYYDDTYWIISEKEKSFIKDGFKIKTGMNGQRVLTNDRDLICSILLKDVEIFRKTIKEFADDNLYIKEELMESPSLRVHSNIVEVDFLKFFNLLISIKYGRIR